MVNSDLLEDAVIDFFAQRSIDAKKIDEESDSKTPDFLINDYGGMRILIELKIKYDDPNIEKLRKDTLEEGEIYEHIDVLAHNNSISKVSKEATKQLAAKKSEFGADMCFIFFLATSESSGAQMEKIETTLYGKKEVWGSSVQEKDRMKECFYYSNSEFFNRRSILDGVFIVDSRLRGRLCINSVSENYSSVIESEFVKYFDNGVLDPNRQEAKGKAFVIDGDVDRRDTDAVDKYLRDKYELDQVKAYNWPHISMTSFIPLEAIETDSSDSSDPI